MATTKKFRVKHGLDAGNNTISFVNDPVSANDVATKNYVDTVTSSLGSGDVSNSYLTSTFTTNTAFQSALANTNAYIATKTDDTTALATNTALRSLISDRIQVANVTGTYVTNTAFQSALANTNAYIATKTDDTVVLATNTALRALISDRVQVANADAKYATWSSLTSTNTAIRSYVDTEVASLVDSAPTTLDTLNELAAALGDDPNFATTLTTNLGQKLGSTASVTLTGDVTGSGSFSSNAVSIALTDTNLGNTNARIDLINTNLTSTNTTVRTLISDRIQVANVTSTYVTNTVFQSALANTNAYIATKTDDTTVLATNTALRTLIDDRIQVANLNTTLADYWPSANVITYTAKYLEVANSSTGTSVTVSNSAPAITANGELWWDNATGELYVAYNSAWVEAVAQDVTPYANNATFSSSNNTITFTRTDASQFDVVLTGVGEVTNAYVTSTFTTNTVFQSALANTNSYIATKTDDTVALATNTALRTLISDRIQVANVTGTYVTNTVFQSALANTNSYIATESARIDLVNTNLTGTNTALRTLISDRIQVANADSKYATWSSLTSTNTAIRAYVDTEVAAIVNSAPVTLNTLNELADALGDDPNFATTLTTNLGQKLGATASVTLTGDITGTASFSSNAVSVSTTDTNLGNTNAYIATKTDDTTVLATNTALRTLISDRLQVANAAYVTANTISVKNPANYHEYTVTVDTKTSAHPYTGTGSSSGYFLDGVEAPSIILAPNQTYRFDQSDSTNSTHPLVFYTSATSGSYTTGVTSSGTPGSSGAYTEIVVDEDTPQVLYYMCSSHANMGSVASILSDTSPQYLQVANVATELASYWPSANVIAYTAKYLEVANSTSGTGDVANSYLSATYVTNTAFQSALANTNAYIASIGGANTSTSNATLSGTTATFTRDDSSTFTLDLSSLGSGGTPFQIDVDTFTANGTAVAFTHTSSTVDANAMIVTVDGVVQRPITDYTVSSKTVTFGAAPANTSIVAIRVTSGSVSGANSFSAITVSGGNTLLTTTTGTELNIVAGNNMIIDANDTTKTLTISSSASGGGSSAGSTPTSGSPNSLTFDLSTGTDFTATISPNGNASNTSILFSNIPAFGSFNFTFKGESVVTGGYDVTNFATMVGQPHHSGTDEISPKPGLPYGIEINPTATRIVIMNRGAGLLEFVPVTNPNDSPTYGNYFEGGASGSTSIADTVYGDPGDEGDIRWTDSGSSLILVTKDGILKRFKCSTAYNLSTYDSNDIDSYDLTTNSNVTFTNILGLEVSPDGTKFFFADNDLNNIYEFTASTAYDITSLGSTPTNTFTPTSGDLYGISFNDDGTALYQTKSNEYLDTHFLSTAYDLSSHSSTTSNSLSFDAISAGGTFDYSDSWPSSIRWALDGQLAVHTTDGDDTIFFMWIADSSITSTNPNAVFSSDIIGKKPVGPSKDNYISFTLNASSITGTNKLFYNGSASSAEALGMSLIYGD
jgi:pyridoxal/pyridoxine/pyridoxamine kinase